MRGCGGDCGSEHTGGVGRMVCPKRILACLEDLRGLLGVLPGSVETVVIMPWRPEGVGVGSWSSWQPRCEYFFLLQTALRLGGRGILSVEVYGDERSVKGKGDRANCVGYLLGEQWVGYWPMGQTGLSVPETLEVGKEIVGAGMSLTMYGRLNSRRLERPLVPLYLDQLRFLTLTGGRMRHQDVINLLRAHRGTIRKLLLHNVILGQGGYRHICNEITRVQDEEEHEMGNEEKEGRRYPHLIHFEIVNAWERDFDRVLDLKISARKIVFGPGDGVVNGRGRVTVEAESMREGIEVLKNSMRSWSAAQASRRMGVTG